MLGDSYCFTKFLTSCSSSAFSTAFPDAPTSYLFIFLILTFSILYLSLQDEVMVKFAFPWTALAISFHFLPLSFDPWPYCDRYMLGWRNRYSVSLWMLERCSNRPNYFHVQTLFKRWMINIFILNILTFSKCTVFGLPDIVGIVYGQLLLFYTTDLKIIGHTNLS